MNSFLENRTICEVTWKNTGQPKRTHMTIWRVRIACWISKAKSTHRICNTYCFSTTTMVAPKRLNVKLYVQDPSY